MPQRALEEPVTNKYGTTSVWTKQEWEEARKNYYVQALKLTERGLPSRGELQRLGLDFIIPVLEPMGVIG
jgi:aldehyde:ferredoxin oxidoreductase